MNHTFPMKHIHFEVKGRLVLAREEHGASYAQSSQQDATCSEILFFHPQPSAMHQLSLRLLAACSVERGEAFKKLPGNAAQVLHFGA